MKFIKVLQKTEAGQPSENWQNGEGVEIPNEGPDDTASEGFLGNTDLKIGAPGIQQEEEDHSTDDRDNSQLAVGNFEELTTATLGASDLTVALNNLPEFLVDPARVNPHLVSITQPGSPFVEEYRSLRTQIIHSGQRRPLQSIVIASVGPAEGKSVTALNLSWMMAQTDGIRALVIDGDLRKPSLSSYLGFETETGFSAVLAGETSFQRALVRLQPAGLCLLPGGRPRPDVAELISGPKLGEILEEACGLFDYVIIDAPPLGIFSDAAILINHAEAALLVVRAGHTRYKDIERKLENLPREKMLGVVLNQSNEVLLDSNYYDYAYPKNYLS